MPRPGAIWSPSRSTGPVPATPSTTRHSTSWPLRSAPAATMCGRWPSRAPAGISDGGLEVRRQQAREVLEEEEEQQQEEGQAHEVGRPLLPELAEEPGCDPYERAGDAEHDRRPGRRPLARQTPVERVAAGHLVAGDLLGGRRR